MVTIMSIGITLVVRIEKWNIFGIKNYVLTKLACLESNLLGYTEKNFGGKVGCRGLSYHALLYIFSNHSLLKIRGSDPQSSLVTPLVELINKI